MMDKETLDLVLGTWVLWVLVAIAAIVAHGRTSLLRSGGLSRILLLTGWIAVCIHSVHFTEELYTGLYQSLPQLLGFPFWPRSAFIAINLVFITGFIMSLIIRGSSHRGVDFPLWVLAVASCANAFIHPALALRAGDYFPGLLTSPLVGISGMALLITLMRSTQKRKKEPAS